MPAMTLMRNWDSPNLYGQKDLLLFNVIANI
jgi:hypothetical protein